MLGTQDLLVIFVIVVVLFGAKRIPELGKSIGEAIKNYKKGLSEPDEIDVTPAKNKQSKEGSEGSANTALSPKDRSK